jgi:hypothetical protein
MMSIVQRRTAATPVRIVVLSVLCAVAGCASPTDTPRGTAERFLDAHYVQIDLPAARSYTSGLARQKIDNEARLTSGQVIDAGTRMPRVHYRLVEEQPRDDTVVSFVYDAEFRVDDAATLHRKLQLTVRRDGEVWSVTNYQEY